MEFIVACAVMLAAGFVTVTVQNWVDHRRYMRAHENLRRERTGK